MPAINLDKNLFRDQFSNLIRLVDTPDKESVQRDIARQSTQKLTQKLGMNESEAKGALLAASRGHFESKGLQGTDLDAALEKQLRIINAGQADENSFRLWLSKYIPQISTGATVAGYAALISRAASFAQAVAGGGSLAAGFAAMGPVGYAGAALILLATVLPSALNTSNDYTAMQPTMMASLLNDLRQEFKKGETVGVTSFGNFTEQDFDNLLAAFRKANIPGYEDPIAAQTRLMTRENIKDSIRNIVGQLNTQGESPTKGDVYAILSSWLLKGVELNQTREPIVLKTGVQLGDSRPTGIARVTESKTAKPKLFLGTVFGDKVAEAPTFIRHVDDKITSEEDLINDVQINMTNWLTALPGKLSYEIQIKNGPFDNVGVKKQGTWATLALYINAKTGNRLFIDEVLLGPLDPIQYFPETTRLKSIAFDIQNLVTPTELTTKRLTSEMLMTVDETGNVILDVVKNTGATGAGTATAASGAQGAGGQPAPTGSAAVQTALAEASKAIAQAAASLPAQPSSAFQPAQPATPPVVAPAPVAPIPPTSAKPIPKSPGAVMVFGTNGEGLRLRAAPSLSGQILRNMPEGTFANFEGGVVTADGHTWWQIKSNDQIGWAASEFLLVR